VGRGHLIRIALAFAAALAAAAGAAAATGVSWTVLATGKTTPGSTQGPVGYIAVTKAQEQRFVGRLSADDAAALRKVNLQRAGVIAVFLDGLPCTSKLTVNRVTRTSTTATVVLHYTRPPVGVAMCVRTSTPYVLIGASRKTLGQPAPTRVHVDAVART
jgi:hypothetical protein